MDSSLWSALFGELVSDRRLKIAVSVILIVVASTVYLLVPKPEAIPKTDAPSVGDIAYAGIISDQGELVSTLPDPGVYLETQKVAEVGYLRHEQEPLGWNGVEVQSNVMPCVLRDPFVVYIASSWPVSFPYVEFWELEAKDGGYVAIDSDHELRADIVGNHDEFIAISFKEYAKNKPSGKLVGIQVQHDQRPETDKKHVYVFVIDKSPE